MGNFFFSSSSKSKHHGSGKKTRTESTNRDTHHHNDNRSGGKLKQSNSCSYPADHHPEHGLETHGDNPHGYRPENVSPFQRDYPAPHQILVPLEKYRPRRSNIRRSARQPNNSKSGSGTNDQLVLPSDNHHKVPVINHNSFDEPPEKNQSLVEEPAIDYDEDEEVKTNVIPEKSNENDEDDDEASTSKIDDLDPSERNKLARTKLTELLRKQKQVMPVMNNNHQKKYPNEPNSEHSNPTDDPEGSPDSRNVEAKTAEDGAENGGGDGEEVLVRRPRKPLLTHGNAMLIDELKKRQSNLYDPARKLSPTSVSGPPPPTLVTTVVESI